MEVVGQSVRVVDTGLLCLGFEGIIEIGVHMYPLKTNMAIAGKSPIFDRRYIPSNSWLSIVMLVFWGVVFFSFRSNILFKPYKFKY